MIAALHDAENGLAGEARLRAAFRRPAERARDGFLRRLGGAVVGRTFVKDHGDVRAEQPLDFHRFLRPEKKRRAIQVRTELDAVGGDFADFGQTENLEAAAVGQNGAGPAHKLVQAAGGAENLQAGTNGEMVGVAQQNLGAHLPQLPRVERLDTGLRADRHEDRRLDHAAGRGQPAQARPGKRIGGEQIEHPRHSAGNGRKTRGELGR